MTALNRCARARVSAGLSVGQAARRLGVTVEWIGRIEASDVFYADACPARLADLYGVNLEWLSGRCDLRDDAAIRRLDGADKLSIGDRDMLAELFASRPRSP